MKASHPFDLFRRKMIFYQHEDVQLTVIDRYNLENLFVEPHSSDSQHLRRARAQNVPDVVPSDAHVHVEVKKCKLTDHGGDCKPLKEDGVVESRKRKCKKKEFSTPAQQSENIKQKYLFLLFRPSSLARRKPYGNMLLDDLGSIFMSLKYFGLEKKAVEKGFQLILLVDSVLEEEEKAVLDLIVPRKFVWTRVAKGRNHVDADLTSWGAVIAQRSRELGLIMDVEDTTTEECDADEADEIISKPSASNKVEPPAPSRISVTAKEPAASSPSSNKVVCVQNFITGFAAAGYANSDEIHNHLSTPAYKEIYDDTVGMALSLGLDRGGTSVPDLLGFREFLYDMRKKMRQVDVDVSGEENQNQGNSVQLAQDTTSMTNTVNILVALPCCPAEYFLKGEGGRRDDQPATLVMPSRTTSTITQKLPGATEHLDSVVVGKPLVATRYVLDEDHAAIPGNRPGCATFDIIDSSASTSEAGGHQTGPGPSQLSGRKNPLQDKVEAVIKALNSDLPPESKKFSVSFVNSCEFLPAYYLAKAKSESESSTKGATSTSPSYAAKILQHMENVDILFTLAGFDAFEHDAFVTQAVLLPQLATILAPYRSMEAKDKAKIDEASFNLFNMESLFPRHTRVLPSHHGALFQLRRLLRHRAYLNVQEFPMYPVAVGATATSGGGKGAAVRVEEEEQARITPSLTVSYNVTKHRNFLRKELLRYQGFKLGVKEETSASTSRATNEAKIKAPSDENDDHLTETERLIQQIATKTGKRNPSHSLAYSFCDQDTTRTNIGEYCQVQIWSAGGCSNLPLAFGGPQDFYKWYYAQNFDTFVEDTTEWTTSSELRHWRVCYGVNVDPHVVARKKSLEKELAVRTSSSGSSGGAGGDSSTLSTSALSNKSSPWSTFTSKQAQREELATLQTEDLAAGIIHLDKKIAEQFAQKYSTTAAYGDVAGWRHTLAVNQYSPGLLGVLKLPCPRRSYQVKLENVLSLDTGNKVLEPAIFSDKDEPAFSTLSADQTNGGGYGRSGRCSLVFAPTVGWVEEILGEDENEELSPVNKDDEYPFDLVTGSGLLQKGSALRKSSSSRSTTKPVLLARTKMAVPVVDDAKIVAREAGLTTHLDAYYRPEYGNYSFRFLPTVGSSSDPREVANRWEDGDSVVAAEEEVLKRAVEAEMKKASSSSTSESTSASSPLAPTDIETILLKKDEIEPETKTATTAFEELVVPPRIDLGADFPEFLKQHLLHALAHRNRHGAKAEDRSSKMNNEMNKSGAASLSSAKSKQQEDYSSHLCNLGPNCYFQNICFQQFANHNQAKPVPPHGHMSHKKITLEVDLAYAMSREEHVILTTAEDRNDVKTLPGSFLGKLWTSVNYPVLANRKDECAEIRVNVYSSSRSSVFGNREGKEDEIFGRLNTANRMTADQLRTFGTADFKTLLHTVDRVNAPLLVESEENKDQFYSRFTRGPEELDRVFYPRIIERHPLWDFLRTSHQSNSVEEGDEKLLAKRCADTASSVANDNDPRTPVAVIFGRYKCCAHNVGHVLLDEAIAVYRFLEYWELLDHKKYKIYLFLEKLKNAEYFYLTADKIFTWDELPKFGCFKHLIAGQARLGYYNPYDWHKGMKDQYDILTRAPKSAPFGMFFPFRDYVMRKYNVGKYFGGVVENLRKNAISEEGGEGRPGHGSSASSLQQARRLYTVSIFQKDAWKSENCCVFVNAEEFRDMLLSDKTLPIKEVRLINWVRKSNLPPNQMFVNEEDRVENSTGLELSVPGMTGIAPEFNDPDRRQCLNSEYSMQEQVHLMATTDILISFSGADMGNIVFLPEKSAVISFSRYMGWKGDPTDTTKQPGWRTSFELASWGRHRPYLIRKEYALEITGMYNYYAISNEENEKKANARPVFLVRPRKEGPAHTPKINEVSKRFQSFLNETSHRNARDGRMIKFLHMGKLPQILKMIRSIVRELDEVHGIHADLGLYEHGVRGAAL
ncbi:unnamed protein product [Amoebophrya sp. A120]|nr:unnamed protein product [Amoebophrya sp. A120]|eukprot:GSA120T00009246001.1